MIMMIQDILLDDLKNGSRSEENSNRSPTHIVGVVRCPQSVKVRLVANSLLRKWQALDGFWDC